MVLKNTFYQVDQKLRGLRLRVCFDPFIDASRMPDALVDLRLLASSAVEACPPLKILLVGQESRRHTLKRAEYIDIVNRVSVRYQRKPFSKDQTHEYLAEMLPRKLMKIYADSKMGTH